MSASGYGANVPRENAPAGLGATSDETLTTRIVTETLAHAHSVA
jgi:hypothetical protein